MYDFNFINVKMATKEEKTAKKSPMKSKIYCKNHFYEENKVFCILAKIAGGLPISIDKAGKSNLFYNDWQNYNIKKYLLGNLKFKILSGITIYSVVLLSIVAICSGFILNYQIHILQEFEIDFDDQIIMYGAILYLGLYILPLLSFLEGNKIAKYFTSWINFEVSTLNMP